MLCVDTHLGDAQYIASNRFTAADISVGYTIGMASFAANVEPSRRLQAYYDRLKERPAYQRAVSRSI
jgi:glutathione S-transferase